MKTGDLKYLVLFITCAYISVVMFFITFVDHLFMTSEIPIYYSSIEAKVYVTLVVITTVFLMLTVLFSKKYILPVTLVLGVMTTVYLITTIRTNIKFPDEMDLLTDWAMPVMFIIPTFLGIVLTSIKRISNNNNSGFQNYKNVEA